MFDPSRRWPDGWRPPYAGLVTFAGCPYTDDPAELDGFDVAIIGAPTDDLVTNIPGTRFGPRAIRAASPPPAPGPSMGVGVNPFSVLNVVDFGDAAVIPADPERSLRAIRDVVAEATRAGTVPIVLGGDHSITSADALACSSVHGSLGLVHFDTHTDTDDRVYGLEYSHGTPMRRLVEAGAVDPQRYVQIGLRGYWPDEEVMGWQREQGVLAFTIHDVRREGLERIMERTLERVGDGPAFLTVDIDAVDPAYAPGTGTPEPGGLTPWEVLEGARTVCRELDVRGADVVEVSPTAAYERDLTAMLGDRIVRAMLTGIAERRGTR